jgi:hypothetical protein
LCDLAVRIQALRGALREIAGVERVDPNVGKGPRN